MQLISLCLLPSLYMYVHLQLLVIHELPSSYPHPPPHSASPLLLDMFRGSAHSFFGQDDAVYFNLGLSFKLHICNFILLSWNLTVSIPHQAPQTPPPDSPHIRTRHQTFLFFPPRLYLSKACVSVLYKILSIVENVKVYPNPQTRHGYHSDIQRSAQTGKAKPADCHQLRRWLINLLLWL